MMFLLKTRQTINKMIIHNNNKVIKYNRKMLFKKKNRMK